MAVYDLEITSSSVSKKTLKFLASLTGQSTREIDETLQLHPLIVKQNLPLSDAVELERHLKLLGAETRLIRREETLEPEPEEPAIVDQEVLETPPELKTIDDIIEIPEAEIKILHPYQSTDTPAEFKRKKVRAIRWKTWIGLSTFLVLFALASWYTLTLTKRKQVEVEVNLYINQWENTVREQDLLLDKGFPPDRIFYKLDELEGSIERLLTKVRPVAKAADLRQQFNTTRAGSRSLIRDLAFRRVLADQGYPIHPTCMVDRGMVQGTSDLPESTLLRINLMGQNDVESVYYAARISGGSFRLIIDPAVERNVYDARATVASYSQQPRDIQRWAERKFALNEVTMTYLPSNISIRPEGEADMGAPTNLPDSPQAKTGIGKTLGKSGISLSDPGSDRLRGRELEVCLSDWTASILSSGSHDLTVESNILEEIYHRLLDLEVRINQLLGLFESSVERNIWIERREEVYGSFIGVRQEIEDLYQKDLESNSPLRLEGRIGRALRAEGLEKAEVLVVDSPGNPSAFVIELDIPRGDKDRVLIATAKVLAAEIRNSNLALDRIGLHFSGATTRWKAEQILKAADALQHEGGERRCVAIMELSGVEHTMP